MKLKDYIKEINDLVEKDSKCLELDLVFSKDSEGNGYNFVHYGPTIGIFEDGEFIPKSQAHEFERSPEESNSICLN